MPNADPDRVEAALATLGYSLPRKDPPSGPFLGARRVGHLVFLGGHGPLESGHFITGVLGRDLDVERGRQAAALALVNALSTLRSEVGNFSRVRGFVKLFGMVNSTPDFTQQTEVVNAASELLIAAFGERGRHTRSAVGMSSLPRGIAVELELIAEVE